MQKHQLNGLDRLTARSGGRSWHDDGAGNLGLARNSLLWILAFAIPLLYWVTCCSTILFSPDGITPPDWMNTIKEFHQWRPESEFATQVFQDSQVIVLVIEGKWDWVSASGPAVYLFSPEGQLVSWEYDSGDGFWQRMETLGELKRIPLAAVIDR